MEKIEQVKDNYKKLYGRELSDDSILQLCKEKINDAARKFVYDNVNVDQAYEIVNFLSKPKRKKWGVK